MPLLQYISTRIAIYLVVLFIGLTITFFLPRFAPSDPVETYIGTIQSMGAQTMTADEVKELRAMLRKMYGLEGSLFSQYIGFLERVLLHFDFGPSFSAFPAPVSGFLLQALPYTVGLLFSGIIVAWIIGNFFGIFIGYFPNNIFANIVEFIGQIIYPIPQYIAGFIFLILFSYVWMIFPLTNIIQPGPITWEKISDIINSSALPFLSIAVTGIGIHIIGMKSIAFTAREQPYVIYARLKGVKKLNIVYHYVGRNVVLPQITALALSVGLSLSGSLLLEIIFTYPGLGTLLSNSLFRGDYNMLYGVLTVSVMVAATVTLIIDLLYPLLDPRIRFK